MRILYFASLREELGIAEESLNKDQLAGITSVADLKQLLAQRGANWQQILHSSTRVALNQQLTTDAALVKPGDEVAFFPPVTGG